MSKISGKAGKRPAWMNKEQSDTKKNEMGDGNRVRPLCMTLKSLSD